ncbi:MAG TPA: hypothetical protein PKY77_26815 [Phycisphaerae bacterium]|nr:hypothetical protein [Phycisphaerae bacterium]
MAISGLVLGMGAWVLDLTDFWEVLESNFPLGGARIDLEARLGSDIVAALERAEILSFVRQADAVSCPHPGGAGCPRRVVELEDGRLQAICGNDPPECADLDLAKRDIEVLTLEPERLCAALRSPLSLGGKVEPVAGLHGVYRVGSFVPQPGVKRPIYFVARCSDRAYAEAFDALLGRAGGESYAIVIATDRFTGTDLTRQMATFGIPIVSLQELVTISDHGQLTAAVPGAQLFVDIGRRHLLGPVAPTPIVARARTHDGWQDLDEVAYAQLIDRVAEFDLMADELSRRVWKRVGGRSKRPDLTDDVQAGYFRIVHMAVEKVGYFDPSVDGPDDLLAGKQIFQRARKAIDVKYSAKPAKWRLFKTVNVDHHAEYQFQPDPDFRFALIFLPRP